jgi:hypothetical protein
VEWEKPLLFEKLFWRKLNPLKPSFLSLCPNKKKKVSTKKVEIEQKGEVWIDAEKFAHVKA